MRVSEKSHQKNSDEHLRQFLNNDNALDRLILHLANTRKLDVVIVNIGSGGPQSSGQGYSRKPLFRDIKHSS